MKRTKLLSYATMITLLAPAIIGVHKAYAETVTITTESTEETLETETTATTESSSMQSTSEIISEFTEESSSEVETLDPAATKSNDLVNTSDDQQAVTPKETSLPSAGDNFEETYLEMFPDENLRKEVMKKANASFEDDLVNKRAVSLIYRLDANYLGIKNLEGIQNLSNLVGLNLVGNFLEDLTPLGQLGNLEILSISGNNITDFSPLNRCKNLVDLTMGMIPGLTTLDSLAGITSLEVLYAGENPTLTDIKGISSLLNLKEIDLQNCKVTDISPLAALPDLKNYYVETRIELPQRSITNGSLEVLLDDVKVVDVGGAGMSDDYTVRSLVGPDGLSFKEFSNGSFKWDNISDETRLTLTYETPNHVTGKKNFSVFYTIPIENKTVETTEPSTTEESSTKESETIESTTPSTQETAGTTSSQQKTGKAVATPSSSSGPSTAGAEKNLPETGSINNGFLAVLGTVLLSIGAFFLGIRKRQN